MFGGRRIAALIVPVASAIVLLTGCAGGGEGTAGAADPQPTLAETKSVAQLLRNEAASRLPEIVFKEINGTNDVSEACESATDDPDGLSRSWLSSMTILLTNSQSARIATVSQELADSFVADGWVEKTSDSTDATLITLTNENSLATIAFSVEPKADGQEPAIRIATSGPCVPTAGEGSDEVLQLEGRD